MQKSSFLMSVDYPQSHKIIHRRVGGLSLNIPVSVIVWYNSKILSQCPNQIGSSLNAVPHGHQICNIGLSLEKRPRLVKTGKKNKYLAKNWKKINT